MDGRPGTTTEPFDSGSAKSTSQLIPDVYAVFLMLLATDLV